MKMKTLLIITLIASLTGCRGREVSVPLAFEGSKLVIRGKLEAGKPVSIRVTKTFPQIGDVPDNLSVTDASVTLFRNGSPYATLHHALEEGVYSSDSLVDAGQSYTIKVEAEGFPVAESRDVVVPSAPPEATYTRKQNVERLPGYPYRQDLVHISVPKNTDELAEYVTVGFIAYFDNGKMSTIRPSPDNILANDDGCHAWSSDRDTVYSNLFLMAVPCMPEAGGVGFLTITGDIRFGPGTDDYFDVARKLEMRIGSVTREWFEYNRIEGRQPEGMDHLAFPPQMAYTNITNGYGLLYATNEKTIEVR